MVAPKDKVALITGGTRGLGEGIAYEFGRQGAKLVISGRDRDNADKVLAQLGRLGAEASFVAADVTQEDQVKDLIGQIIEIHKKIDILVNSAGVIHTCPLVETKASDWDRVMSVNVKGVFLVTKYTLPWMIRQHSGAIINIASLAGKIVAHGLSAYCTSKAAVIQLTKATALEGAAHNVRANVVCPTLIDGTDMSQQFLEAGGDAQTARQEFEKSIPLGRLGSVEDVAAAVLFLATDRASFLTGTDLAIDGGVFLE